jgi:tetratricopeptide (TPR) repeat protein
MRRELQEVEKSSLRIGFPRIIFLNLLLSFLPKLFMSFAVIAWTPIASAQVSNFAGVGGEISGTVLLDANKRPASQVAVSLKSHVAGIFRSVLTDLEGHFKVQHLPPGTYEIVIDEAGYDSARSSAQLNGSSSELVLYLKSSTGPRVGPNRYTVSVHELRIPEKAQKELQKGLDRLIKNDPGGSLAHFRKATAAYPEYYEAHYHAGVAELRLGHHAEAMQAFQKAIDLSCGRYARAAFGIGYLLYLEGNPGEAEKVIRRGLEADDHSPDGHSILGMALLRLDRLDEAERSAREALLRNPNFAEAYLVISDVYGRRHDYRAQLQNLDAYLRLQPSGSASERVRQAREITLRNLAESHPQD